MGKYEEVKDRRLSAPEGPRRGLYPLPVAGTYGPPPQYEEQLSKEQPGNLRRNRGVKTYASYSVSR